MTLQNIVSAQDGPRVTVATLVKNPLVIPKRIISLLDNQFVMDSLLRPGGDAPGGAIVYSESTPLFPNGQAGIKEEFGEYPIIVSQEGQIRVVTTTNRGFSILISEDMRRRNSMDRVNLQMTQGKNLMIKTWDTVFNTAVLTNPSVPTLPVTVAWNQSGAKIRFDIGQAKQVVTEATSDTQADNFLGFNPNVMVMSPTVANVITYNDEYNAIFQGNIADQNISYVGKLPNQLHDLTVLVSLTFPDDKVLICERNTIGFIANERPLQSTPLYEDQPRETWRSDTSRISAVGIDQPQAGVILTGVTS